MRLNFLQFACSCFISHCFKLMFLFSILLGFIGCNKNDEIKERVIPASSSLNAGELVDLPIAQATDPRDGILGAIYPLEDDIWFFKITGKKEQILNLNMELEFHAFLETVKFKNRIPEWTLPGSWKELNIEVEFRYATFVTSNDEDAPVCTVSKLEYFGNYDQLLIDNVNRWRGQLGLPNASRNQLFYSSKKEGGLLKMPLPDRKIIHTVMMLGTLKGNQGMKPPMMQGNQSPKESTPSTPGTEKTPGSESADTKMNKPDNEEKPVEKQIASPYRMSYNPVKGWDELPPQGFNRASFIKQDDGNIILTVVSVKTTKSDPLENVNIWRGVLGLAKLEKLPEQSDQFKSITLAGSPSFRIVIDGKLEGEKDGTIIAAIQTVGDET